MTNEIKKIIERLDKLENAVFGQEAPKQQNTSKSHKGLDFSSNERAFIKKYSSSKFTGQEHFALICAYLAKGKVGEAVKLDDIKGVWKRCAGVMNNLPYSSIYSTRAKENEWVDVSTERGVYLLGKGWQEIFQNV